MILLKLLGLISLSAPLFVFFDYNRRSNIHYAIAYVAIFALVWDLLNHLIGQYHIVLAAAMPFLLILFLFLSRISRRIFKKRKPDGNVLDA